MTPQEAYSFVESQAKHIERKVYRKKYASIQYKDLVPIDTSAQAWARGITYYSSDAVGSAAALGGRSRDFPLVNLNMAKDDSMIEMFGLGYDWSIEEIAFAKQTGNINPIAEKAAAVRRIYEEKLDSIVKDGASEYGWHSLMKPPLVRRVLAGTTGTGSATKWSAKTAPNIISDVNNLLMGVYYGDRDADANDTGSSTVEMADTILMSPNLITDLNEKIIPNTDRTVINFIEENNVYTRITGKKLRWRVYRGLEEAGWTGATVKASGTIGHYADGEVGGVGSGSKAGRIVAYRRDPEVLKLHLPMPLRFLPVWQNSPMTYIKGAIFRPGGLEVRLPGAMRVMDGVE